MNIFQPSVGEEELEAVQRVFETNWIGQGEQCRELEYEFADHLSTDCAKVLLLNSCTSALYVGLRALGIQEGDSVIIPSIHFVAAFNAVWELGATPTLVDVDSRTLNIDPGSLERALSFRTKAVILLHYGGHVCEIDKIWNMLTSSIAIIEDAANAPASTLRGQACGALADMGVWSFDAMKIMTMGDGGVLWMDNEQLARGARRLRYLGLNSTSGKAMQDAGKARWWEYTVSRPSGRFISNDIAAAIGRVQLRRLPEFIARRKQIWKYYQENLPVHIIPPEPMEGTTSSYYLYWIQSPKRDEIAQALADNDIYSTFRYYPLHLAFKTGDRLPNAEYVAETTLNLPLHQSLTDSDVEKVVDVVKGVCDEVSRVPRGKDGPR